MLVSPTLDAVFVASDNFFAGVVGIVVLWNHSTDCTLLYMGGGLLLFKPFTSFLFIFTTVLYETIEHGRHIFFKTNFTILGCSNYANKQ